MTRCSRHSFYLTLTVPGDTTQGEFLGNFAAVHTNKYDWVRIGAGVLLVLYLLMLSGIFGCTAQSVCQTTVEKHKQCEVRR